MHEMFCFVNFDKRKCTWCKFFAVSNCPRCQIVRFYPWCQIVRGVKLSWCQIVRCQIVRGVKLSGVKLSAVSNCPPTLAVSNCPRCQIVLVSNCPRIYYNPFVQASCDPTHPHPIVFGITSVQSKMKGQQIRRSKIASPSVTNSDVYS